MLFFGAKGSKVRLHYDIDFCPNFLTQLEGTKTIWLFPPEQTKYLYKYPFSVHSPIDFKNPDVKKYPLFKNFYSSEICNRKRRYIVYPSRLVALYRIHFFWLWNQY